jgi:hypothetical protein
VEQHRTDPRALQNISHRRVVRGGGGRNDKTIKSVDIFRSITIDGFESCADELDSLYEYTVRQTETVDALILDNLIMTEVVDTLVLAQQILSVSVSCR